MADAGKSHRRLRAHVALCRSVIALLDETTSGWLTILLFATIEHTIYNQIVFLMAEGRIERG